MNIASLKKQLQEFAAARDWDQYHNPKNLAMALSVEASELQEIFQWLTAEESEDIRLKPDHAAEEIADVFIYLVRLADVLNIDIEEAVQHKLTKNAEKYRAEGRNTPRSKGDL